MKIPHIAIASYALVLSPLSIADVQSLTSSELTETYIQDSTIIVTPAKREQIDEARRVVTYTIGPAEPTTSAAQQHGEFIQDKEMTRMRNHMAVDNALQASRDANIGATAQQPVLAPLFERPTHAANIPGFQIPEGSFDLPVMGDQLGLSSNGQQLTFSIGNVPGADPIQVQRIQSEMINLMPREGGGFDLTIPIPQQ
jgi:hypothetical protein